MTSVGINAASFEAQTGSFVSVSISQVSVASNGSSFSQLLGSRIGAMAAQQSTKRTYTDIKVTNPETGKESTPVNPQEEEKSIPGADQIASKTGEQENTSVQGTGQKQPEQQKQQTVQSQQTGETQEAQLVLAEQPEAVTDFSGNIIDLFGNTGTEETASFPEIIKTDFGYMIPMKDMTKEVEDCISAIEIVNTLLQGMADILQTTVDKLQGCYEQLDIEPSEMFSVTTIQLTVVTFTGLNDTSDLLVNNDAFDLFNRLNDFVNTVFEEAGMDKTLFGDVVESDLFAYMFDPEKTGNIEEMLSEAVFDEDGKIAVIHQMPEEAGEKTSDAAAGNTEGTEGSDPFTVEVNIDKTVKNTGSEGQNSSDAESGGTESTSAKGVPAKNENRTSKTILSPAETFVQGLEKAIQTADIDMPVAEGVTVRDIVYQVVEAIRVNITNESTSLEMNLNPENLGRVNLNIESRNGVMTAHIVTENETARAALESQLQILKDNFEAQGVRVEAIEVTVSGFTFSDSRNSQSEAREHPEDGMRVSRNRNTAVSSNEEAQEEEAGQSGPVLPGEEQSTVNYTA